MNVYVFYVNIRLDLMRSFFIISYGGKLLILKRDVSVRIGVSIRLIGIEVGGNSER